jgi:hypothetical protein
MSRIPRPAISRPKARISVSTPASVFGLDPQ